MGHITESTTMPTSDFGPELQAVIQHLVRKVVERARAGERTMQLKMSRQRNERYGCRLGPALSDALESAGVICYVRQWTGQGHTGVLEVAVELN